MKVSSISALAINNVDITNNGIIKSKIEEANKRILAANTGHNPDSPIAGNYGTQAIQSILVVIIAFLQSGMDAIKPFFTKSSWWKVITNASYVVDFIDEGREAIKLIKTEYPKAKKELFDINSFSMEQLKEIVDLVQKIIAMVGGNSEELA